MEFLLFITLISFAAGFLWGRYTTKMAFAKVFKLFSDEMHRQYVQCLKAKGIKVKTDSPFESTPSHNESRMAS